MKLLWVCNLMPPVIAGALGREAGNREGWLDGLCHALIDSEANIELHIAFPDAEQLFGTKVTVGEKTIFAYSFPEDLAHPEKYDPALEEHLLTIVTAADPDVIHCFGTEFPHTLALLKVCPHPERVLVGLQGICSVIADSYMADLPAKVCNSRTFRDILKKDSLKEQQAKFVCRGAHETEALKRAHHVTGRTDFDREAALRCNPYVNYYPANETLRKPFYEGEWDETKAVPHRIFVSQGDYPLKGLHYMIIAAAYLRANYPDVSVVVAGNSIVRFETLKEKLKISAYGKYLRKLMQSYGMQDKVTFLGRLSAEQMKETYLSSSLFVCCSANENSPNSLGEAMLLGVPCVAADVGGIPTIFQGDVDGPVYKGFRADEHREDPTFVANRLAAAINTLWHEPEKQAVYTQNARNHAKELHDPAANIRKMVEIYAKIADSCE